MKDFTHPKFPTIHIKLLTTDAHLSQLNDLLNNSDAVSEFIPEGTSSDNKYLYGIFDDAKLVGVIDLIEDYPTKQAAYIHRFILEEDYVGNDLPSILYLSLEKTAQETGIKEMILDEELAKENTWTDFGFVNNKKEI
ncbi:GNAT family N-acetyltransferase [Vagococcus hydrophili]|uniref:GNAT family N-acetyltransferase n=1 Tax=Vagococcus hydrophili TaxID=2714947 RepID=A0A6G8ART9_9ENTE|nr:GNAT family N-acetyltransferase [Vagococcus hydrophili]QIL47643.1 GNAT family N-acetyltransferase [Vagococcus hydrophili]